MGRPAAFVCLTTSSIIRTSILSGRLITRCSQRVPSPTMCTFVLAGVSGPMSGKPATGQGGERGAAIAERGGAPVGGGVGVGLDDGRLHQAGEQVGTVDCRGR